MLGGDRYTQYRHRRVSGEHTGQVCGPTGAGNNAADTVSPGVAAKLGEQVGSSVRGYDLRL